LLGSNLHGELQEGCRRQCLMLQFERVDGVVQGNA
jgi:hypothetical protein